MLPEPPEEGPTKLPKIKLNTIVHSRKCDSIHDDESRQLKYNTIV